MDLDATTSESSEARALRDEVRAWLSANWNGHMDARWLARVVDAGYAAPRWPKEWFGRALPDDLASVIEAEFRRAGAPGSGQDRLNLWANTVLAHGSDALKQQFLRPLLQDEVGMCLLYSEPGAGSDLASLQTTAVRDGDEWIVNGQKVWTSGARQADYAMLIARTDWDAPKHRGITFFWFPMKQPGVEIRPIRQITGDARFNEVFLTDARVPDANRLGELNKGWWVLQTALAYERAVMGVSTKAEGGTDREGDTGESGARERPAPIPTPDLVLVQLARDLGRGQEATVRQALARLHAMRMVNNWNGARAAAALKQGTSSPLVSLSKLAMSQLLHYAGRVQGLLLGAEATLDGTASKRAADANYSHMNAYFTSIGGGTDQIQRNIIGERLLGLPREPELDKDVPFRELRKAAPSIRDKG